MDPAIERAISEHRRRARRRAALEWPPIIVLSILVGWALSAVEWGGTVLFIGSVCAGLWCLHVFVTWFRALAKEDPWFDPED